MVRHLQIRISHEKNADVSKAKLFARPTALKTRRPAPKSLTMNILIHGIHRHLMNAAENATKPRV